MSVESLSVCFINPLIMRKATKETINLWPFVWILIVALSASVGSMVLALFITN